MMTLPKLSLLFRDEEGSTTVGVALALLISLSLIFTSAQVYRVNSAAADVQDVADAVALAAENEIAEFMIVVRACDAVVLSLSLTGIIVTGLGVAALCTPATAAASEVLLKAGREVLKARDSFADKASSGLNSLQRALPFLAAACAASVASANNNSSTGADYLGFAVLVPAQGASIEIDADTRASEFAHDVDAEAEDIKQAAQEAEDAAREASACKERAFRRDCGDNPSYCMYERASTLAGMSGALNPCYTSVDTWSFSVALSRAQTYYERRFSEEAPQGSSVEEGARSALRKNFYRYASDWVNKGYVHETSDSFEAYFPHLPKNTAEMRETSLYTEAVYPLTATSSGSTMHAWPGCPDAASFSERGSLAHLEAGGFITCGSCDFSAASLGKVAAASTSIENGFEYHYEAVAQEADNYQRARAELDPLTKHVKAKATNLFDTCLDLLRQVGGKRIDAQPPGRFGVISFAVNTSETTPSAGFANSFIREKGSLGTRAALSAATLIDEGSSEGKNVLSSLVDNLRNKGGVATGAIGVVLECWSGLLQAYLNGQEALSGTVEKALDSLPLTSESGLGSWAASAFEKAIAALGLEPAKLDALKPVLVNSVHVANAESTPFTARFLSVKSSAIEHPLSSTDLFSSVITAAETAALESIENFDGKVEIASIQLFGEGGPHIPLVIALPPAAKNVATDFIGGIANNIRSLYAQVTGVRVWE